MLSNIASIPHLEALLLLRAQRAEAWTAAALAERLYIGEAAAHNLLGDLVARRMVRRDVSVYRYGPETDALGAIIDEVAELYSRCLVEMTHLIHSRLDRQAQHFADAFRWRKDS